MTSRPSSSEAARFHAEVVRLIFRAHASSFAVVLLRVQPGPDSVRAVGTFPEVHPGQQVMLEGMWEAHATHGRQLRVTSCLVLVPETLEALEKLLASGVVEGVGPGMASRLVTSLGEGLWAALDAPAEAAAGASVRSEGGLESVPGLGAVRASRLRAWWFSVRTQGQARLFLAELEVSGTLAERIVGRFGARTEAILRENPWMLADTLSGVGFVRADALAQRLGVAPDAPGRAEAAVRWLLGRSVEEGHVYCPASRLLDQAMGLGLPPARVLEAIHRRVEEGELVVETLPPEDSAMGGASEQAIYLKRLFEQERAVAELLLARIERCVQATRSTVPQSDVQLRGLQACLGLTLADEQREAVIQGLSSPLLVISGGPGTGKTTLVRALIWALKEEGVSIRLAAPTGRAARRLQEATGQEASTVHRLLEVQPPGMLPGRKRDHPLEGQVLLVDEVSMMDLPLFAWLLDAMPLGMRLILVGDVDQLPPVGPGNVLDVLLRTPEVPRVLLGQVFRQGQGSLIRLNAQRIRRGLVPILPHGEAVRDADFFFVEADTQERCVERVVELVAQRLPERYGLDAPREIQVLSPMHRGDAGVVRLNECLQAVLNPGVEGGRQRGLRPGDKVIQVRNRPESGLYNGDIGYVRAVSEGRVVVGFEEREVVCEGVQVQELERAWAMTVHRSQGSEFPVVVMPVLEGAQGMLKRNLLYTAVTRARRLVVLVGSWGAVVGAVVQGGMERRYGRLWGRLREGLVRGQGLTDVRTGYDPR